MAPDERATILLVIRMGFLCMFSGVLSAGLFIIGGLARVHPLTVAGYIFFVAGIALLVVAYIAAVFLAIMYGD